MKTSSNVKQISEPSIHLKESDLIVISTNWPEYQGIVESIIKEGSMVKILDPYRLIRKNSTGLTKSKVIQLGVYEK
jgi:hypothetical protein